MDRSKPFRRLLPVGVVSVAGLAGCCTAPAYRAVVTSQPPHSVVAAVPAPGTSQPPAEVSPEVVVPAPSVPGAALPALPPATSAPPLAPPQSNGNTGSVAPAPPSALVPSSQLYLNAPMGTLQSPLPPAPAPPAASQTEAAQPAPAITAPNLGIPVQAPATHNGDSGNGTAPGDSAQKPLAKNKKSAKPNDPPPSPLARLRKRFHDFAHPPTKPAPKKDGDQTASTEPTTVAKGATQPVIGYRVPLPTAEPGVAVRIQTPLTHPMYAADDVETTHPAATNGQTAAVAATSQLAAPLITAQPAAPLVTAQPAMPLASAASATAATSNKAANEDSLEQWPYRGGASTMPDQPQTATQTAVQATDDDFTAIPVEEYRATVLKIEPQTNSPAHAETAFQPPPAPPATSGPTSGSDEQHVQSPETAVPVSHPVRATPAAGSGSAERPEMIVIPQAVHRTDRPEQLGDSSSGEEKAGEDRRIGVDQSNEPAVARGHVDLRDLSSGPPAPTTWRAPSFAPRTDTAGATQSDVNHGSLNQVSLDQVVPAAVYSTSFNPGWTLPPAIVQGPVPSPGAPIGPGAFSPVVGGRYGQPAWMTPRSAPSSNYAAPAANAAPPVLVPRDNSGAPAILNRSANGG
jgi:hypothetical protein